MKVFLGGTCQDSTWRKRLIPMLEIDYFNPVVDDWNEECQKREVEERKNSDFVLYVITPKMEGFYSIAEVVDDSNKRPEKTIFCILKHHCGSEKFTDKQVHSLKAVQFMVMTNGAKYFDNLKEIALFLNKKG